MRVISINVGQEQTLQKNERSVQTGIFKCPVPEARLTLLGLEGDAIVDGKYHGGPDQAVYIYGEADYDWWRTQLGRDLPPGLFGENLTISELQSARFQIGDLLHIGETTLQVSAPRFPCGVFAARMEDPQWVKKFRDAERPGLYCRVIREGMIRQNDSVSIEPYRGPTLSIVEMYRFHYAPEKDVDMLFRHLTAPIDVRTRHALEEYLQANAEDTPPE